MDNVPLVREVSSLFKTRGGSSFASKRSSALNTVGRWVYTILALILVFGGSYYLFNKMERPIAGILYFIGAVIAVYFYWVKWFMIPAQHPDWPPYQTICPDYLTPVAPGYTTGANGQQVPNAGPLKCVDFVGVSQNGRLKVADPSKLDKQLNQSQYAFSVDPKMSKEDLKAQVNTYGLSWQTLFGQ